MRPPIAEAIAAAAAALIGTLVFVLGRAEGRHWAGTWLGHALGVVGIALMLFAALDYRRRKRAVATGAVAMKSAMGQHIVAGLLGPYLVLLHAGGDYAGLAGVLTFVVLVVVASGIVGRAIYTALPRVVTTADPVRAAMLDAELARLEMQSAELIRAGETDSGERERIRREMTVLRHKEEVLRANWQAEGGAVLWRRALSGWWYLHVPLSAAMWLLALVHIIAALWYGTFSR